MIISELFKDAAMSETARTVWSRRGDQMTKHVVRKHELTDVKPRVRFNKPELAKKDNGAE
jgi:hypothetical protein